MSDSFLQILPSLSSALFPMAITLGLAGMIVSITLWTYYGSRQWTRFLVILSVVGWWVAISWNLYDQIAGMSALSRFGRLFLLIPPILLLWLLRRNRQYEGVQAGQGLRTWVLIALRLGALLCTLFIILSPSWVYHEIDPTPSRVIVLLDTSRSMETKDEDPRLTRWQALQKDVEAARDAIAELQTKYNVQVVFKTFDSKISPHTESAVPAGEATAVYRALEDAFIQGRSELQRNEKLQGIVILSDGRDNVGQPLRDKVIQTLRRALCPVHAVGLGQPGGSELQADVVMVGIDAPSTARVKDRLVVRGTVQAQRFQNNKIEVWLFMDDKPVVETSPGDPQGKPIRIFVEPRSVSETIPIEMPAFKLPDQAGDFRLTLKALPRPGELTDKNNQVSTYISLTKDGLSVLYFDKKRWESRFLVQALKNDERISVFTAYLAEDSGPTAEQWRQQVRDTLQKSDFDVFIIGDIPAARFGDPRDPNNPLHLLKKKVEEGGKGLLMIGGHDSFANGGWDKSPIAEVLPVEMDEPGMLEPPGSQREVRFLPREQVLQDDTALGQFVLRLDSDFKLNREWWETMPPLSGANRLGRRRGDATVLVELADQAGAHILLAVQKYGKGRGAALAVDTTWQWFRGGPPRRPEDVGKENILSAVREAHLRFWRQLILWLAQQDTTGNAINVELAQRRLAFGKDQVVTVQAREVTPGGARDAQKPLKGATFDIKVYKVDEATGKPDLKTERAIENVRPLGGEEAKSQAIFGKLPDSGEYAVVVKGRHLNKDLGSATARFMVYRDDTELLNRSANHADLETIATRTSGSFQLHGGLRSILQKMREDHMTKVTRAIKFPDWDDPSDALQGLVFLLFAACLSTEWVLRRWWGLV